MVVTHSEDEWHLIRSLRNQGRPEPGGWLEHVRLGFNYRLSDIAAALGIGQMERLDEILARALARRPSRYSELLGSVDGLELPCADDADHRRSWFVYVVLFPDAAARERVDRGLRAGGDRLQPLPPVDPPAAVHASSASASRRACARSPRTSARARSRFRSSRGSRPAAQERVAEVLASAL